MNKLISCMAAGVVLLAAGMEYSASAAPLSRGGASSAGTVRGGGSSVFRGNAGMGSSSPVFRGNPGVVTAPGGSLGYRGNSFAYQGRDRDGDRGRHHRRFVGAGVFAYGADPDYYGYDDGSAYIDDTGDCSYVWVRGDGVLHRVYTCQ
jgi:hypothetical protein